MQARNAGKAPRALLRRWPGAADAGQQMRRRPGVGTRAPPPTACRFRRPESVRGPGPARMAASHPERFPTNN
ncbi:hypothetical protein Maq22A_c28215 [Methylobacterium aquaticum]|uniref:Uncharacterized protein n=1 Tax=Methylobacterium aquaticum TaxID=270351 RepID=A0A1Y0Z8N7_9HYPH|nr:hypothetical protein Maq22A_c28215 [Methylobacterium aquaticum]